MSVLSLLPPLFRDFPVADVVRMVQLAEQNGYGGAWYADERFQRDTYTVLAALAGATTTIKLGPAVTDPYTRHPVLTAAAMATLAELAPGRARLGIGAGIAGFVNLGIELRHPATAVREAIQVVRSLLAGESVTIDGEVVSLRDGRLRFPSRADVPIYVAADGPAMLRTAGRHADGVIVAHRAAPSTLRSKADPARTVERRLHNELKLVARLDVTVNPEPDRALDVARVRAGRVLWSTYPDLEWVNAAGVTLPAELDRRLRSAGPFQRTHDLDVFRQFADAIPPDLVGLIAVAGSVDQVATQFQRLLESGVDELMVHPLISPGVSMEDAIGAVGTAYAAAIAALGHDS